MVEDKIKLGYFVATAELRIDEKVTAYQGDMERSFNAAKPYLTHIHVCDSNRLAPGRGNLDFGKILRMLKATGYTGYISVEINQHPDQDIVIEEAINVLRPLL